MRHCFQILEAADAAIETLLVWTMTNMDRRPASRRLPTADDLVARLVKDCCPEEPAGSSAASIFRRTHKLYAIAPWSRWGCSATRRLIVVGRLAVWEVTTAPA